MAIWSDVADWIGPTPNRRANGITAHRGLVLHIQEGSEAGTEAWQRNPASQISSHFLAPKTGRPRQMVDTNDVAWTEAAGNDEWLSVEIEGHGGDTLTADQLAGIAAIYAKGVQVYNWPMQATDSPSGKGLGWHGMGGAAWGSHYSCPGDPIKNARGSVLAAAQQILAGNTPTTATEEDDMSLIKIPAGFAADEKGNIINEDLVIVVPVDPSHGYTGYLSVACDLGSVRLRVADHPDGAKGYQNLRTVDVTNTGGRVGFAATPKGVGSAFTIARQKTSATDSAGSHPTYVTVRILPTP